MRLLLTFLGLRLDVEFGPDDGELDDTGPGASAALEQQGPFGFTRYHFTDDPDE